MSKRRHTHTHTHAHTHTHPHAHTPAHTHTHTHTHTHAGQLSVVSLDGHRSARVGLAATGGLATELALSCLHVGQGNVAPAGAL